MTEDPQKNEVKEGTEALKAALARIADIFGVFDLSFFVAGVVCFGAVMFGARVLGGVLWAEPTEWSAIHVGAVILSCYVLGLVCFAAGRKLRRDRELYAALPRHLRNFGIEARYADLMEQPDDGLLYTRLWAEVRQSGQLAPSYNLLMRYWVMAAMCDGLAAAFAVSCLVWALWGGLPAAMLPTSSPPLPPAPALWLVGVALGGAAVLCRLEAMRYARAQMYELVATLAYAHRASAAAPAQKVAGAIGAPPSTPRRGREVG